VDRERVAIGLETSEGEIAPLAGLRADSVHAAFLGVDDSVGSRGIQRSGDGLVRVIVGLLFLFAPELSGIH
jgi:hypothetical protein